MNNSITYDSCVPNRRLVVSDTMCKLIIPGKSFTIYFQNHPINEPMDDDIVSSNGDGYTVENLLEAAQLRLTYLDQGMYHTEYNTKALDYINLALEELNKRTVDRESRGVKGTSKP